MQRRLYPISLVKLEANVDLVEERLHADRRPLFVLGRVELPLEELPQLSVLESHRLLREIRVPIQFEISQITIDMATLIGGGKHRLLCLCGLLPLLQLPLQFLVVVNRRHPVPVNQCGVSGARRWFCLGLFRHF